MPTPWKPIPDHTYLWNTAHTVIAGCPVVTTSTVDEVDLPAGASTDIIVGVATADAGPNALAQAVNATDVPVQVLGTALMYGKSGITAGAMVKINTATINVTPAGYASAVAVWPVTAATQTAAGSQPYPIVGRARNGTTADGDIVYVDLLIGEYY